MNVKQLLELVKSAQEKEMSYYELAALIAEAQKEADAQLAETLDAVRVADAIRISS